VAQETGYSSSAGRRTTRDETKYCGLNKCQKKRLTGKTADRKLLTVRETVAGRQWADREGGEPELGMFVASGRTRQKGCKNANSSVNRKTNAGVQGADLIIFPQQP
jgi:hypothetical protein